MSLWPEHRYALMERATADGPAGVLATSDDRGALEKTINDGIIEGLDGERWIVDMESES